MAKYIDREEFIQHIEESDLPDMAKRAVIALVRHMPAADVVEVVHGYWHIDDYDSGEPDGYAAFIEVHCSKCGYELGAESGQYGWIYGDPFPLNYCPSCGAKMDGERKETDEECI